MDKRGLMKHVRKEASSRDPGPTSWSKGNVSFDGSGRVSVSVASIVSSARVQEQVVAVRAIQDGQVAEKR